MSYLPTVISTPPPSRRFDIGENRPRLIRTLLDRDPRTGSLNLPRPGYANLKALHLLEKPSAQWNNFAASRPHGSLPNTVNGTLANYTRLDPELKRYVVDFRPGAHYQGNFSFGTTSSHPLYNSTSFVIGCWLYMKSYETERRLLTLNRTGVGAYPAILVGTDFIDADRLRILVSDSSSANSFDRQSNTAYPLNRWFSLWFYWSGGTTAGVVIDGEAVATTLRSSGGTVTNATGGGTDFGNATMSGFPGYMADYFYFTPAVSSAIVNDLFANTALLTDASIRGLVRGVDLPEEGRSTHRVAIELPPSKDERFSAVDEGSFASGLTLYWPIEPNLAGVRNAVTKQPYATGATVGSLQPDRTPHGLMAARSTGSGNYIQLAGDYLPLTEMSISLWYKPPAVPDDYCLIGTGDTSGTAQFAIQAPDAGGTMYFFWGGNVLNVSVLQYVSAVEADKWHHLFCRAKQATGQEIYLDGTLVASHNSASTPARTQSSQGVRLLGGRTLPYKGSIAEVAIWDRLLSAAEGHQLFREPTVLRKYHRSGHRDRIAYRVPTAPASNAQTTLVQRLSYDADNRESPLIDRWQPNFDHASAKGLTYWFQPNGQPGRMEYDHMRRATKMVYDSGSWNDSRAVFDVTHGWAWQFAAADSTRAVMDSLYNSALAFSQNGFTVELLFFPTSTNFEYLATYGTINPVLSYANWLVRYTAAGEFVFTFVDDPPTAFIVFTSDSAVRTVNAWNHAIFTHTGAAWRLFVNGVYVSVTATGGSGTANPIAADQPLRLGAVLNTGTGNNAAFFTGRIAMLRIWQRAMTDNEAIRIANGVLAGRDPLKRPLAPRSPVIVIPDRHWTGEDTDWYTPWNWSRAAGGRRGAGVPRCDDKVFFDADRPEYE